jgi:hypothetical protein
MRRKLAAILAAEGQRRGQGRNALLARREVVDGEKRSGVDCFDSVAATFPDVVQATRRAIEIQLAMTDFGPPQRFRDLHTRPN